MARQQKSQLDFNNLELLRIKLQKLSSAPTGADATEANAYYNDISKTIEFHNGTAFISVGKLNQVEAPDGDVDLASNKLINVLNPTGAQDAATRGYTLGLKVHDFTAPTANLSMNSNKITNLLDGSGANDAVNKGQLDVLSAAISAIASGQSWKDSVRVASTTDVVIATALENGDTLQGETLATGDRIGLFGQTVPAENGIYVVPASGAAPRSTDADAAADFLGMFVPVEDGDNAGKIYYVATDAPITLNTTALTFTEWTGATYSAGDGLTLTGTTFAVGAGNGITVTADTVAVDPAVVVRKYAEDIGDNTTTSIVVTHGLNTRDVTVSVHDKTTPFQEFDVEVRKTSVNTITLVFAVAPTTAQYRVTVHG